MFSLRFFDHFDVVLSAKNTDSLETESAQSPCWAAVGEDVGQGAPPPDRLIASVVYVTDLHVQIPARTQVPNAFCF